MHISPTENTTNLPRKDEYPDRLMLPAQTEIRAQKYSPFEVRARLCARVLELTKLSMSYQQIQTEIFKSTHIRLSKGSISGWVRGIHNPSGGKNKFRAVASPELAYVIGVIAGDGNLSVHGYNYEMLLSVTDYDFAEEFSRCLAKILGKSNLYKVRWSEKRKRWIVQGSSIILHRFLSKPWQHLKNHIEHSSRCRFSFLRALFDGEGSITGRNLTISNTDLSLLLYVRKLLAKSGISTRIPRVTHRAGSILKDPSTGRTYKRRKDCYVMRVSPTDLLRFARKIGFSIERKKRVLPSFVDSFETPRRLDRLA
jgi:intein-encoded DNA endonuclease-like protein